MDAQQHKISKLEQEIASFDAAAVRARDQAERNEAVYRADCLRRELALARAGILAPSDLMR
jgi:hypothetical protein